MNKNNFDALEPDVQSILKQAGKGMADKLGELITVDNQMAIDTLKSAGVEVIEMSAGERQKLVEKGKLYTDKWTEQAEAAGLDATAILGDYLGLIDKYTTERETLGYPWLRN